MYKKSVIIVGAGISGLMAACELGNDFNITVLEGRSRIGGRILTDEIAGTKVEGGAEFIHGDLPLTMEIMKDAGASAEKIQDKIYRKENGRFYSGEEMFGGWDLLLKNMKDLKKDMTLDKFLETYYGEPTQATFRKHINAYAEGFDLAKPDKASSKALYNEWSAESNNNFRIKENYISLIHSLNNKAISAGCKILKGKVVKKITHELHKILLLTEEGEEFEAEKVIISIPVGVLQSHGLRSSVIFSPAIPHYIKAINEIGNGKVIKIILKFREAFWQADAGFILSDGIFPTWWPNEKDEAFITGWCGGSNAEKIENYTEDDIMKEAIISLANIFELSIEKLKEILLEIKIYNWQQDEFSAGGYTYSTTATEEARQLLNKPFNNTLYFAGEGFHNGPYPGTVEAALMSGKNAAFKVKSGL